MVERSNFKVEEKCAALPEINSEKNFSPFKSVTKFLKKLFQEKYREYQERKQQKLLKDIQKQFNAVGNIQSDKSNFAEVIRKTIDGYQQTVALKREITPKPVKRLQQTAAKAESLALFVKEFTLNYKPSQQELDIFRLKAIRLMKERGFLPDSITDALNAPIQIKIGEASKKEPSKLIIKFSQCLNLGEKFYVEGAFIKDTKAKTPYSIPLGGSFKISK